MNNQITQKQQNNWWLDLLLFAVFLAAFLLDLTGVDIHQWLGVGLFALILLHLARHASWINGVFEHFFGKASNRARGYALIDLLLMLDFLTITFTGLVISTWLNLYFTNYDAWVTVHVISSISGLVLLVLKTGLHWRWIVCQAGKIFKRESVNQGGMIPEPIIATVNRRQFLVSMGLVSVSSVLAVTNVLPRLKELRSSAAVFDSEPTQPTSTVVAESQATQVVANSEAQVQPSATAAPQATATVTTQPTQVVAACSYRCRKGKHCAFPGKCHDYIDNNSNALCDLGECM